MKYSNWGMAGFYIKPAVPDALDDQSLKIPALHPQQQQFDLRYRRACENALEHQNGLDTAHLLQDHACSLDWTTN